MVLSKSYITDASIDTTLTCLASQYLPVGVYQCAHELISIPDDCHLLDDWVDCEHSLEHLWSDVLTVGSLEEILNTLCEIKGISLKTSSIARTEEAILGEGLRIGSIIMIIARSDRRTFD